MNECILSKEVDLRISERREVLFYLNRFKLRMIRMFESISKFWAEYEKEQKYVWDRYGDAE